MHASYTIFIQVVATITILSTMSSILRQRSFSFISQCYAGKFKFSRSMQLNRLHRSYSMISGLGMNVLARASTNSGSTPSSPSSAACSIRKNDMSLAAGAGSVEACETEEVKKEAPIEYFRKDYKPSAYLVDKIYLDFDLSASETNVVNKMNMVVTENSKTSGTFADIVFDGEEVDLQHIKINSVFLTPDQYKINGDKLNILGATLDEIVDTKALNFDIETKVRLSPVKNLALSGLYKETASELLCTQCEAMGFRRITYHYDRPDVLSVYTVRMEGSKETYPLLLSNGNKVDEGEVAGSDGSRHWAVWEDPFPKPSYLFALVAGDLGSIHSTYTTTTGRVVQLGIYSDKENADKLDFAMYSLKESMQWDEDTFNLECDLDVYNIVATNDFNMGAMENKGLNVFNSAYVLADPSTATDVDYERILGVIGHEYFHNWSGNRVTVRDWFQLTLKEGLTVYRDQWFSSDKTSHAVKRIEDVRGLRSRQFAEDGGPMSHPIRPESYISMDNFYTGTVYSKGAEVVGLYRTLLSEEGFKKGLKLYFDRHDGGAVTCDDFRHAMADANNVDLSQMDRWYSQAGTPVVKIEQSYDETAKTLTLTLHQRTPTTPGPNQSEEEKLPLLIPITVGLLHPETGHPIGVPSTVLELKQATQSFVFHDVPAKPVLSALRGFSAPVKLEITPEQTDEQLIFLMAHDTDSFNKWDAGNRYYTNLILDIAAGPTPLPLPLDADASGVVPSSFLDAIRSILNLASKGEADYSLAAYALQLPDETTLLNLMPVPLDIDRLHYARKTVKRAISVALQADFALLYSTTSAGSKAPYAFSPKEVGRRRLMNTCLDFLTNPAFDSLGGEGKGTAVKAKAQFDTANCMTEKLASLGCLVSKKDSVERKEALAQFHKDAAGNALVLNKWFAIQAMADYDGLLDDVKALKTHPDFLLSNPNRARALISSFSGNLHHFHKIDGSGYEFISDCIIELDALNPQVAARMTGVFSPWKKYDKTRRSLMEASLRKVLAKKDLSPDTFEVVTRCLD